jgi:hypothetical protein
MSKQKPMKKKEKEEMEFIYHYIEPKTKEEKEEQEWRLSKAYDILFEATLKRVVSGNNEQLKGICAKL